METMNELEVASALAAVDNVEVQARHPSGMRAPDPTFRRFWHRVRSRLFTRAPSGDDALHGLFAFGRRHGLSGVGFGAEFAWPPIHVDFPAEARRINRARAGSDREWVGRGIHAAQYSATDGLLLRTTN